MSREKEFEKIKKLIKEYFNEGNCGLFDTRNLVGDPMDTIFEGKYFVLDICYYYSYFEVFGTTDEEFERLMSFYNQMR